MNYPSDFDPADYIKSARPRLRSNSQQGSSSRLNDAHDPVDQDSAAPGRDSSHDAANAFTATADQNANSSPASIGLYAKNSGYGRAQHREISAPGSLQPHLGYTLAVLLIGVVVMLVVSVAVLGAGRALHLLPPLTHFNPGEWPIPSVLTEAFSYGVTIAIIVPLFRRMWHRPFADVLQIAWRTAQNHIGKLLLFGAALSVLAQLAESRMTLPKEMPIDAFFKTRADLWVVALFGIFVAPLAEELFFRGFLFRSLAIAFDWFSLRVYSNSSRPPVTNRPEDLQAAHTEDLPADPLQRLKADSPESGDCSRSALIASGILTSILFAIMHAAQLGFAWNAVAILTVVGGVLTAVRVRFQSVAASSLVHMAYNGFIFAVVFIATDGFRHLDKLQHR